MGTGTIKCEQCGKVFYSDIAPLAQNFFREDAGLQHKAIRCDCGHDMWIEYRENHGTFDFGDLKPERYIC